jgi:hypothetical protein
MIIHEIKKAQLAEFKLRPLRLSHSFPHLRFNLGKKFSKPMPKKLPCEQFYIKRNL